jgi:hypothetical protein
VQAIILILVAIVIVVFLIVRFPKNRKWPKQSRFQKARPSIAPPSVPAREAPSKFSAAEMLSHVQALRAKDAQWDAILPDLNPTNDPEVEQLLITIRGPHLFAPHVGLNVIEEGCKKALSLFPNSNALQALRGAIRSQDIITGSH